MNVLVEVSRPVLLTIDVQRDFVDVDGASPIAGATDVVPRIADLAQAFRAAGHPIVHVVRLYAEDGSNAEPFRREAARRPGGVARPGGSGSRLLPQLTDTRPDPDVLLAGGFQQIGVAEWLMYKPRWGAFYGTGLDAHLRALDVDTVVIAGVNFPNCPRATLYEASERDYRCVLVADAVSGTYPRGLDECSGVDAAVMSTADFTVTVR